MTESRGALISWEAVSCEDAEGSKKAISEMDVESLPSEGNTKKENTKKTAE